MNELLCEIMSICYEISRTSKADVFFEYSPHVSSFSVEWYEDGWKELDDPEYKEPEYIAMVKHINEGNLLSVRAKLHEIAGKVWAE